MAHHLRCVCCKCLRRQIGRASTIARRTAPMDLKRIAAALLVAAVPTLLTTPAAYADDASEGGPVLDFGRPDSDENAAPVEVACATEGESGYAAGLAAWPQPSLVRIQPGMVS